jgi:hypothetical protein
LSSNRQRTGRTRRIDDDGGVAAVFAASATINQKGTEATFSLTSIHQTNSILVTVTVTFHSIVDPTLHAMMAFKIQLHLASYQNDATIIPMSAQYNLDWSLLTYVRGCYCD